MKRPRILVVGCMNVDLFMEGCDAPHVYGHTIDCASYGLAPGGKGATQAYAAAKLGGDVVMAGRVGQDLYGDQVLDNLRRVGANVDYVVRDADARTGLAVMLVSTGGQYVCYVTLGANKRVTIGDVRRAMDSGPFDMLVMQLEVPLETVYAAADLAKARGIPVFLDAGPAMRLPLERLRGLYILSPNEAEAEALTGIPVDTREGALRAAEWLYAQAAPKYVLIKLGERGALLYDGKDAKFIDCFRVDAVDSTAAGDTFGACLAVQLCRGVPMEKAIVTAHAAAGICVSRKGAQVSVPTEAEVRDFLAARLGERDDME